MSKPTVSALPTAVELPAMRAVGADPEPGSMNNKATTRAERAVFRLLWTQVLFAAGAVVYAAIQLSAVWIGGDYYSY